jgi:tRNA pseudouridine32 synthase/23S rRNA pseudouridine746 synthase
MCDTVQQLLADQRPGLTCQTQLPTLRLMYLDDALIVVNKAAGQLSVPGRGADKQDCLSTRVQQHYPDACVVHRLDMATSGYCS